MKTYEDEWVFIERFYADVEAGLEGYKRPVDYIERALRVLNGARKPFNIKEEKHNV